MTRGMKAIIIGLVAVAIVLIVYYIYTNFIVSTKVSSQALSSSTVMVTPTPPATYSPTQTSGPAGVMFPVHISSYLSNFNGLYLQVVANPITVGDTVWLIVSTPNNGYVAIPIDIVTAQLMGVGTTITQGTNLYISAI